MEFPRRRFAKAFGCTLLVCLLPLTCFGATKVTQLQPETIAAWEDYLAGIQSVEAKRITGSRSFLATAENAEANRQLQTGRVLVVPVQDSGSARIPLGLINHWTGAVLIRGVKLRDVTAVTRNYERYPALYQPTVVGAKTESKSEKEDRFSMRLSNHALVADMSLDIEYSCIFQQVSDKQLVATSRSTQIRQINHLGKRNQEILPPDEGRGFIWRLVNYARMQQTDQGVVLEFETVVLSRDVPSGFHWMVDPIIRRVAQSALTKTLAQTRDAISVQGGSTKPENKLSLR